MPEGNTSRRDDGIGREHETQEKKEQESTVPETGKQLCPQAARHGTAGHANMHAMALLRGTN